MKSFLKLFGIISFVLLIGFTMIACEELFDPNHFKGTWTGKDNANDDTVVVFTDSEYAITFPEYSLSWTGTYTYKGNNATLINSDPAKTNYKAVVSGKNMKLTSDAGGFNATLSK